MTSWSFPACASRGRQRAHSPRSKFPSFIDCLRERTCRTRRSAARCPGAARAPGAPCGMRSSRAPDFWFGHLALRQRCRGITGRARTAAEFPSAADSCCVILFDLVACAGPHDTRSAAAVAIRRDPARSSSPGAADTSARSPRIEDDSRGHFRAAERGHGPPRRCPAATRKSPTHATLRAGVGEEARDVVQSPLASRATNGVRSEPRFYASDQYSPHRGERRPAYAGDGFG
jgi:hypothetical protein